MHTLSSIGKGLASVTLLICGILECATGANCRLGGAAAKPQGLARLGLHRCGFIFFGFEVPGY